MKFTKSLMAALLAAAMSFSFAACGGDDDDDEEKDPMDFTRSKTGAVANFKYDTVVISMPDGQGGTREIEVSLNGLDVYKVHGAVKKDGTQWDVVAREGVLMEDIFKKANITVDDDKPVNLIGGDGFDVLRGKGKNDLTKLPHMDFMRAFAYVYADDPGSKHKGYPYIGNDSLIVDYDLAADSDVPAYIGDGISALSMLRMKMMEKANGQDYGAEDLGEYYGLIEIDPQIAPTGE